MLMLWNESQITTSSIPKISLEKLLQGRAPCICYRQQYRRARMRYSRDNRELKQTRRRRKRERHLKIWLRVSATIFQLFKLLMLEKCVLTILELNWNQSLAHKKTKLNIWHHALTSSTQLQNRSFDVVERTRTSLTCQKMKNARAKRAKILFFIVKYANLWGFCCRRRRCCLSSLITKTTTLSVWPASVRAHDLR